MIRLMPYITIAMTASFVVLAVSHSSLKAELADVQRDHVEQLRVMAEANATELEQATRKAESLQQQVAAIDAHYTQELNDAKANVDRLRTAVDAGTRRLHILAKRPTYCPAVPGAADDTRLGDGAAVELSATAGRAYHRLRNGLTSDTAKLAACQAILRQVSTSNHKGTPEG